MLALLRWAVGSSEFKYRQYVRVAFSVTHRMGDMNQGGSDTDFDALLDELDVVDPEHPSVAVSHESGWTLGAFPGDRLTFENVEADGPPRHMVASRPQMRSLFAALARGDLGAVEAMPWKAGYGS